MYLYVIFQKYFKPGSCEYVPGSPGGAWSAAELLVVRAKLWKLFSNNFVYKYVDGFSADKEFGKFNLPPPNKEAELGFFAAKVLRLRQGPRPY